MEFADIKELTSIRETDNDTITDWIGQAEDHSTYILSVSEATYSLKVFHKKKETRVTFCIVKLKRISEEVDGGLIT